MVQITPEEVILRRKLEQQSTDELDGIDRMIVGDVALPFLYFTVSLSISAFFDALPLLLPK